MTKRPDPAPLEFLAGLFLFALVVLALMFC